MFGHFKDDCSWLVEKYRHDSSDPSTGLELEEILKREVEQCNSIWKNFTAKQTKAAAFEFCCRQVRIDVSEHDFFPTFGCWNRSRRMTTLIAGVRLDPARLTLDSLKNQLNKEGLTSIWTDFDHSVPDWDALFTLGFPGILRRAEAARDARKAAGKLDQDAADFFDGVIVSWRAAIQLIERFAELAHAKSAVSRRIAFEAASLDRLLAGKPENTYDAMMLIYLYYFISEFIDSMQVRSLGNLDDRLYPFVKRDIESKLFSEIQIRELIDYFFMQWGSINNYWGQPVYFGGTAADGSTLCNPLTSILLEEYGKLDIISPKIQIKIAENIPDDVLRIAFDLVRKGRNLVFVCESGMRVAMKKLGMSDEEARTCDITGCYEFAPRGISAVTGIGYVNMLKLLERLDDKAADTFDGFFANYCEKLFALMEDVLRISNEFESCLAEINPANIFSGTIAHSLAVARDAFADGAVYNNTSLLVCGFGSVVDALSMVREFVYKRREITLAKWTEILQNDWKDAEIFRMRVLNSPERYGNHRLEVDAIGAKLAEGLDRRINNRPNARGGVWSVSSHPARMFLYHGRNTGATPDGRRKGDEMSKNLSPANGMDRQGCTALLESAVAIGGPLRFPGDSCVDLMVHPSSVAGEEGFRVLKSLLLYYMRHNGHAIQFNVFDPATLRDAQEHPEKYASLMVRVCGWNTRFNDMDRAEQNAYIERSLKIAE